MAAKVKKPASRGKPRATATKKQPAKPKPKLAAKPKPKAAAKPTAKAKPASKARPGSKPPRAKAPPKPVSEAIEPMVALADAPDFVEATVTADAADEAAAEKKPGALARLKSGVGSLFAKMTRRKDAVAESDGVPIDAPTMEIVTGDIILSAPVRTKRSRKTPPPPPAADEE